LSRLGLDIFYLKSKQRTRTCSNSGNISAYSSAKNLYLKPVNFSGPLRIDQRGQLAAAQSH